jgi:hypothetical protein
MPLRKNNDMLIVADSQTNARQSAKSAGSMLSTRIARIN